MTHAAISLWGNQQQGLGRRRGCRAHYSNRTPLDAIRASEFAEVTRAEVTEALGRVRAAWPEQQ